MVLSKFLLVATAWCMTWLKGIQENHFIFPSSIIAHAQSHNNEGASNQFWSQQQRLCHYQTPVSSILNLSSVLDGILAEKWSAVESGSRDCIGLLCLRLNSKWKQNIDYSLLICDYQLCLLIWNGNAIF